MCDENWNGGVKRVWDGRASVYLASDVNVGEVAGDFTGQGF